MLLAGCSKDADISNSTTLSGNGEKTPLLINATLDTGKGQTRAVGETFADGDELKVYFRHTIGNGPVYEFADAGLSQSLVTIRVTSTGTPPSLSPIYWDDFSDNTDATKDLRTSGHALQSYYAYCYNGQTIADPTGDNLRDGVLTWTVETDQRPAEAFQHSDLLWSPEHTPVSYDHDNNNTNTFSVPFTHAMCQITVELTANSSAGFSGNPLASTKLKLHNMYTQTTLTAPTSGWGIVTGLTDIYMYGGTTTSGLTRTFTAIVAPGTKLKKGEKLLDVTDADGNDYEVIITDAMLHDTSGWGENHTEEGKQGTEDGNKYVLTQPGNNYHLALSIDKSAVKVSASLAPWTDVTATGTGAIKFTDDVTVTTPSSGFNNASAFSLFWVKHDDSHDTPAERTNTAYSYATTSTYDSGTGKWTNSPNLYWPNKNESYYFRALANYSTGDIEVASPTIPSITTTARGSAGDKGTDGITKEGYILWGTTSGGTAISPRTGGVPLEFRVVNKCKVSFTLATADGGAAMDLSEASISISNIYNTGTINLEDGTVTGDATTTLTPTLSQDGEGVTYSTAIAEELAQIINNNAVVTITFKETLESEPYSTYTIPLKSCKNSSDAPIEVWKGGHTYNYTIHVEKEAVKFSAAVKPWATVSGSGTATME